MIHSDIKRSNNLKKNTVLVINHFALNKGNHAVLRSIIGNLRNFDNNVRIIVSSYDKELTAQRDEVEAISWPVDVLKIAETNSFFMLAIIGIVEILSSLMILFLPSFSKKSKEIYSAYRQADIVICPGGHLFTSMNPLISLWIYAISLLLAKKMNKKVIGLSQTVGPFNGVGGGLSKFISQVAIKNMDIIYLRDESSEYFFKKLDLKNVTYDFAGEIVYSFNKFLKPKKEFFSEIKKHQINIGITVHHLYYRYHMSRDEYIKIMSDFCNYLIKHVNDVNIVFIPMEYTTEGPKDRIIISEILDCIHEKEAIEVLNKDLKPEQILSLMKQLDYFIGTKTHSIVMSLVSGTPTLSISYHEKSNYFMKEWGVEKYAINMKDLDAESLYHLFEKLCQNNVEIRERLRESRVAMEKKSEKNFEVIYDCLSR